MIGATSVSASAPQGHGVTGAGVRVGVWDEGHARASHVDLAGRVVERDLGGWGEHATHTTATVAGSGTGSADARGMAPGARVWAFDWLLDAAEMEESAAGIGVSSNAYGPALGWGENPVCPATPTWWGAGASREDSAFGRYGRDAAAVDALAYRTDLLSVWAGGNERADIGVAAGEPHAHGGACDVLFEDEHLQESTLQFGTLGGAAVAKNGLTVGAAADVGREAITPERIVPMDMSAFGPTGDGRIKPELLVGGEAVRSASDEGDRAYVAMSGTSSATAATAGAIALLTELYRRTHGGADPRGVELKALLVHTALDAGPLGPDYGTGYGLLDAQAAADLVAADGDEPASERQMHVAVLDGDGPIELSTDSVPAGSALRATLVWNDPPSAPADSRENLPTLVNDLDLSLRAPDARVFRSWSLDASEPQADPTREGGNHVDNVEVVDVDAVDNERAGRWTVRVEISGNLWRGREQAFAIIVSVPVQAPAQPALAAPRSVEVVVPPGGPAPTPLRVPLANRGRGTLEFRARSLTPWLAVSPASGNAPAELEIEVDTSGFSRVGEVLGQVQIDGDDPAGPRRLGVVARVTCEPDCDGRSCGVDPRCGELCGRCGSAQICEDGACVAWEAGCPHAALDSALGAALVHGTADGAGQQAASCGGEDRGEVGLSWTAPEDSRFVFTTRGSHADTVLYARAAMCGGAELACNDDSADRTSAISLDLDARERVTLFVDAFDDAGGGEFRLNAARAVCPNVDLGSRVGQLVARASTLGGIDETAGACGGEGSEDVAFAWTAPAPGSYRFALFDPAFQAVLYVRDGGCDGSELGCSAATDVGPVELDLAEGQTVAIVVDGREGRAGEFTLDVFDLGASCAGACDAIGLAAACSCDAACVAAGDCCADACESCGRCRCDPDCQGRACGDDGCGGDCGGCAPGEACADGACVPDACAGVRCDACSVCDAGRCVPLDEGAHCEDGDRCTVVDACHAGRCAGEPRNCDDGFACTDDRCDARDGRCVHDPQAGCCEPEPAGACLPWLGDAGVDDDAGADAGSSQALAEANGCGCGIPAHGDASAGAAWGVVYGVWALRRTRRCGGATTAIRRAPARCSIGP